MFASAPISVRSLPCDLRAIGIKPMTELFTRIERERNREKVEEFEPCMWEKLHSLLIVVL